MRRLLIILSLVLVFAASAIVIGPAVLPQATINGLAARLIERTLGYPVSIAGEASLAVFPTFRLHARGVNARVIGDGGKDVPALFDLGAVSVEVDTVSLLYNRVRVDLVRLENPVVRFHVDKDGRRNWRRRGAVGERREPPRPDRDWGWWNEFDIARVELLEGRMLFVDRARRWRLEAERIGLASSKPVNTASGPGFALSGSAKVNGESMALRLETGAISKALAGGRVPVVFEMQGPTLALRYQGSAAKRQVVVSDGRVSLSAPDFERFKVWLGAGVAAGSSGGKMAASATLNISGDRYGIADIDLAWPGGGGQGAITADLKTDGTLALDGSLLVDTLDLTTLGGEAALAGGATLLPDNLSGKIAIGWQRFRRGRWRTGAGRALLRFNTGPERWTIEASSDQIYGGRAGMRITWGLAEGMASLKAAFRISRADLALMLADADTASPLSGRAQVDFELFSVGGTPAELIAALGGEGRFNVVDGRLRDPGLAERISGAREPLPFSQLMGSFRIGQGIVRTRDLLLRTPGLSMVGTGDLDLAKAYINIDLRSVSRRDGRQGAPQIKPLRIEGPLATFAARRE